MLTNCLPAQLSSIILGTFNSIPCPPIVLRLLPAADEIPPEKILKTPYTLLHRRECTQLQKYRLPKRRSEYLTGRICAKMAMSDYLHLTLQDPPEMNQIEIKNSEYGQPFITSHQSVSSPMPYISISHSSGYGAAVAAQHRCGIDIQRQENSLIKVREKYCLEDDYRIVSRIIPEGGELLGLSLLWSAKEAIQKRFSSENSMPTFLNICLQDGERKGNDNVLFYFSIPPSQGRQDTRIITVAAGVFMNYAIAVSAHKENI